MKKIILALLLTSFTIEFSYAKEKNDIAFSVSNFLLERESDNITLSFSLDVSSLKLKKNKLVVFIPFLSGEEKMLPLKGIGIYGRKRYYHYLRATSKALFNDDEITYRKKDAPKEIEYSQKIPYKDWMSQVNVILSSRLCGCCEEVLQESNIKLGSLFEPKVIYVKPKVEKKTRALEGSAFIDFPVNIVAIDPNYRANTQELAKIAETINSVKKDNDVTITGVWLKGYASPESPYSHNADLAEGRVGALKDYIKSLYSFPDSLILTEYEAEDWQGLRKYVEESSLEDKSQILSLIDSDMDLDKKEAKIKATYPTEYKYLLDNCYPELRRTDYKVNYTIREFSDIEEIKNVMKTSPSKLSLNELYQIAETLEPGSQEFNKVFSLAVRLYPKDEIANLNMASIEVKNNNYKKAKRYLSLAGSSAEADYMRGVLAYLEGDLLKAKEFFTLSKEKGMTLEKEILDIL